MPTDPKKKAQTKAKSLAKKQVKKAARKNPALFIALVVVVVVIVAVAAVLYLKVPAIHDAVNNVIHKNDSNSSSNNSGNGGNSGNLKPGETPSSGDNPSGDNPSGDNPSGDNPSGDSGQQNTNTDLVLGDGELKVHFLNVGQGDCIYIQFPDGKDMLIDCGNKSSGYDFSVTKAYLDALNPDNALTYLMLTHGDEDHVDQLDKIIQAYAISTIYMPNILAKPTDNPYYGKSGKESLTAKCNSKQAEVDALDSEKLALFTDPNTLYSDAYTNFFIAALSEENCQIVINMDDDDSHNKIVISDNSTYELKFYCMTVAGWAHNTLKDAHEKNEVSPVGILTYNGRRIVLTGDSNEENEPEVAARIGNLDCDVLKVGHHGSETSSMPVFLDAITCEYAVISCKMDGNIFYHPRQTTLDRLIARNYTIYRTDLNGTIVLTVDKDGQMTFVTQKQATKAQEENGLTSSEIETIKEYKKKLDNGEITQEEYNAKHAEIVGW